MGRFVDGFEGGKSMGLWFLMILLCLCTGCGTYYGAIPTNHIVMVNTEGHPVDPTGSASCEQSGAGLCNGAHNTLVEYPTLTESQYHKYVRDLVVNLQRGTSCEATQGTASYLRERKDKGLPPKLFIFIHGGLNRQTESVERAAQLCSRIAKEGYYPIFLNWQSALSPSYWNHLVHIRQGEDWRGGTFSTVGGYLTAPAQLLGDLSRAIVRGPIVTFFQVRNDIETVPPFRPMLSLWSSDLATAQEASYTALCKQSPTGQTVPPSEALMEYAAILNKPYDHCTDHGVANGHDLANLNLTSGIDKREALEKNWAFTKYFLTLPTKLATAPIIDAGGTSAWAIMLRSVAQLFHYDAEQHAHNNLDHLHPIPPGQRTYKSRGALHLFFEELKKTLCLDPLQSSTNDEPCPNPENWEITLIGHSTGAIIAHHILREFEHLPIRNIVYMGAASSVRDYQETVFPYLAKKNKFFLTSSHDLLQARQAPTRVYHLMLHEAAESGEWIWDGIDPLPRGSLLIWLDNFLSHPLSKEDRTLGRFSNFITTVHHTPDELRPFIHMLKFGVGEAVDEPKMHGDFSQKLRFWDSKCWGNEFVASKCYSEQGHY